MYFFSLFTRGHEFVLLFFVLSGFVIHLGYAKKLAVSPQSQLNIKEYLLKRTRRIYPPFLLAILITMALDFFGSQFNSTILFGNTPNNILNQDLGNRSHSLQTLAGNLFFLFEEYVPIFGTNVPTWSLKLEWWFYIFYIPFLFLSRKNILASTVLIVGLFIMSFSQSFWFEPLSRSVFSSMLCWWLGVIIAEVYIGRMKISLLQLTGLFLAGCFMLVLAKDNKLSDLRTTLFFSGILSFLLWYNNKGFSLKFIERLKPLGDFSYTLYIIHFPILVFLSGIVLKINNNSFPRHFGFVFLAIAVCLITAYLLHFIVEVPFAKPLKSKQTVQKRSHQLTVSSK